MFTAAELGMLTAQKQAKDIGPKRKAKSDAAEYKKMTKDIPEEFHDIRNDMHAWLKETGKSKQDVEKSAYGGSDTGYEYDRWLDGGPAYDDRPLHRSRKRIIDMTKTLADAAKARGADVKFYGEQYADPSSMYSADEAIKRLMAAKQIDDTNESSMPNYYSMEHPRKARAGLAELLRLKTPDYMERDEAFPAGTHPLDVITEKYFKKPKIEKESGELNMQTAADLGRLSAQMHHTKQAEGWSDLPSWLFSLGGHNPFFKQPQQGMGGPVVMPGLNGGRNQLPRQPNMGGPVVMPGFNGGGQPKGPTPPAFDLMPAIRGKAPKGPTGNGIKTLPAPIPTDKAPKTPAIKLL